MIYYTVSKVLLRLQGMVPMAMERTQVLPLPAFTVVVLRLSWRIVLVCIQLLDLLLPIVGPPMWLG